MATTTKNIEELCGETEKELITLSEKFSAVQKLKQANFANNASMMKAGANLAKEAENLGEIAGKLGETIAALRQLTQQLQIHQKQGFSLGLGSRGSRESENNENGKGR